MELREPLRKDVMLAGEYRVDQVLGAGGFGITYLAEDVKLARPVAIKEYFPAEFALRDASKTVRARSMGDAGDTFRWGLDSFLREAQMLARFDHPAITRVMRVIEANGTAYMVLRYEEGLPLRQVIDERGRALTEAEIRTAFYPILDALEIVHGQNVLHRDISPENIIIHPDGRGVLIDFGAARRAVADKSQLLTGIVREGYSPPEQFGQGGRQGPWTDIYALGAVLYHAVTGNKPLTSVHRLLEDQMVPASVACAGQYGDRLLAVIDQSLRLKYAERPQSMTAFRQIMTGASSSRLPPIANVPPEPLVSPAGPRLASPEPTVAATAPAPVNLVAQPRPSPPAPSAQPAAPHVVRPAVPTPSPQPAANATPAPSAPQWMPLPQLLFSFTGRINRGKLWLGFLFLTIIAVAGFLAVGAAVIAAGEDRQRTAGPVTWIGLSLLLALVLWISFALYAKRAHDRGWSGWFTLLFLVPIIGLWPTIELLFLPGEPGPNRYGPNPLGEPAPSTPARHQAAPG